tara:strand:- start:557 stop:703 length:147 start_codon:yes stop_codon:yes gene_type:complete
VIVAVEASGSSSVVEHFLAKEDVEGSNPFSRSKFILKIRDQADIEKGE